MGTALTIRALIGERAIFLREQAVGLSTTAYLLAKVAIFTVFALVQSAIAVTIAILGKAGARVPSRPVCCCRAVSSSTSTSPPPPCARRWSVWRCRRWPSPTNRSCRCW